MNDGYDNGYGNYDDDDNNNNDNDDNDDNYDDDDGANWKLINLIIWFIFNLIQISNCVLIIKISMVVVSKLFKE